MLRPVLLVLALVVLAGPAAAAEFECPVGRTCKARVQQSPSPEVEQICLRELARPDKPAPVAGIFIECKDVAPGAIGEFAIVPRTATQGHLLWTPVTCDVDPSGTTNPEPKRCSELVNDRAFVPADLGSPKLLDVLQQALTEIRDTLNRALAQLEPEPAPE